MARKRRVPEVLWRMFNSRARTLADTIVALVPPSTPSACRCKARGCLACSGDGAMSFLLRPEDPSDYRTLLNQCFVVVSDNAPTLSAFYPDRRWSQREIVKRTIEMIINDLPSSSNVLCSDYDKHCCSSSAMELLTSSAWSFLLGRVGDGVMVYLLKYTSIFLPLPRTKHYQVAGFPISDFCFKSKHISEPKYRHSSLALGSGRKRKGVYEADLLSEKEYSHGAFADDVPSGLVNCFDGLSYSSSFTWHCRKKSNQKSISGEPTLRTRTANCNDEGNPNEEHHGSSNQLIVKPRKRQRQFSWQRHRKRRQFDIQETHSLIQCARNASDRDSSYEKPQSGFNTSMPFQCSCCLFLQKLQFHSREGHICRQSIFYRLECSSSVLPRKRILFYRLVPTSYVLNSLRPNASGANVLFADIFGLSDGNSTSPSSPCYHNSNCCLTNYKCIYHSLVKLLKNLIRKAHHCQHLRLLEKHCPVPYLDQSAEGGTGSIFKGIEFQTNLPGKRHALVQQDGNLPPDYLTINSNIYEKTPDVPNHQFEPSQSYCLKKNVVSFLWAVCRSIVPPDLLGTSSNWRILRKSISSFVRLRRFEKFSSKQCMHMLKTSVFPFLSDKHTSCYLNANMLKSRKRQIPDLYRRQSQEDYGTHSVKHKIVQNWISWFFSCLIVPLVQANFYVTESERGKQNLFYYRKAVWENIMNNAIISLKDGNYHSLDDVSARNIMSKRSFGFSRVRLRPKENGVRVLANLKASSRIPSKEFSFKVKPSGLVGKSSLDPKDVKYDYFMSVNSVLRDLHAVLKGLQLKEPENLGSSVFDYNEVYIKLCPFISALKNGGSTKVPEVFIVVSDVSKAFDSVKQDKLISVMKDIMQSDEYLIKKSHQVVCAKKSLWAHQNLILADRVSSIGSSIFTSFASSSSLQGILVNQGQSRNIRKEELFFDLHEHVKHNVLQLDKHFYLQEVGIPQGSILSSLLCSFYYGHLENKVILPFLQKSAEPGYDELSGRENKNRAYSLQNSEAGVILSSPKYMLLRFIDDFIFISTSKKQATRFFSRLRRGFREYNCYMNKAKFGLNFDVDEVSGLASNRVYVGEDGIPFLGWSGLFINCCTLEVQADYTRYLNTHLSSSLTVCWQGKPGGHLKAKLCDYLRPKCHPIFYDSNINSSEVVRLNIYQAFLLCAMKFHCYVCDLSNFCKLDLKSYLCSIEKSLRYMHKLVKKRMHSVDVGSTFHPIFQVGRGEFEWLGLVAYTRVLKRKQSRHKELLSLLRSKLIAHEEVQSVSTVLRYAVDDSHSSVMWKIRY